MIREALTFIGLIVLAVCMLCLIALMGRANDITQVRKRNRPTQPRNEIPPETENEQ